MNSALTAFFLTVTLSIAALATYLPYTTSSFERVSIEQIEHVKVDNGFSIVSTSFLS